MLEQGGGHPEKSSTYSKTPWKCRMGLLQVSQRMGGLGGSQVYRKDKELIGMDRSPKIQDCRFCIATQICTELSLLNNLLSFFSFPNSTLYCDQRYRTLVLEKHSQAEIQLKQHLLSWHQLYCSIWQNGGLTKYCARHFLCIILPSPSHKVGNGLISF